MRFYTLVVLVASLVSLLYIKFSFCVVAHNPKLYEPPYEGAATPQRYDRVSDPSGEGHKYVPWDPFAPNIRRKEKRSLAPTYIINVFDNGNAEVHDLVGDKLVTIEKISSSLSSPLSLSRTGAHSLAKRAGSTAPSSSLPLSRTTGTSINNVNFTNPNLAATIRDDSPIGGLPDTRITRTPVSTSTSSQSPAATTTSPAPVSTAFSVVFTCEIDEILCNKTVNAFTRAVNRLAATIEVRRTIIISAYYHAFCDTQCLNNTFGWAAADSQWFLPGLATVDPNYVYPQSLAKQLSPYDLAWTASDISCEFNHNAYLNSNETVGLVGGTFWFPEDNVPIRDDQIDMEYLILHEFMHGLGFISSWGAYFYPESTPYYNLLVPTIQPNQLKILTPSPKFQTNNKTHLDLLSGFMPNPIFDKYLYTNISTPIMSLADVSFKLQDICITGNGTDAIEFLQHLMANTSVYNITLELWSMATMIPESLFFIFPNPTNSYQNMTLYTIDPTNSTGELNDTIETRPQYFRPGTAISHLDASKYKGTLDFLMRPFAETGVTLNQIITGASQLKASNLATGISSILPSASLSSTMTTATTANSTATPTPGRGDPAIGPGILAIFQAMGYSTAQVQRSMPADASNDTMWQPRAKAPCDAAPGSGITLAVAAADKLVPRNLWGFKWSGGAPGCALIVAVIIEWLV